ncbi:unknown [Bacteroides stercoris CAG:120]|nr:unknown [Bacteroides stercoris CAG:120]
MVFSVSSAEKANFRLHSTCRDVRSNRRGGASFPFLRVTFVMVKGEFFICSSKASPRSRSVIGSIPRLSSGLAALAAAPSFCFSASSTSSSSLLRRMAEKVVSRYTVFSSQYCLGTKFCISSCRFTMSASVGVCTRPMESTCRFCPYFMVYRRVAFMPNSQSPMARESPASYNGWKSDASLSLANPSRMASSVSEEIHRRFTGQRAPAFCITQR